MPSMLAEHTETHQDQNMRRLTFHRGGGGGEVDTKSGVVFQRYDEDGSH